MTELEIFNCNLKLTHLLEKEKTFKDCYNNFTIIYNNYKNYYSYNSHKLAFKIVFDTKLYHSFKIITDEFKKLNEEKKKLNNELIDLVTQVNTSHDLFSYCKKLYFNDIDSSKGYFDEVECDVILLTEELVTLTNKYCYYSKRIESVIKNINKYI